MSKRVLVLGYYGFGNAGDDAIGTAAVQHLERESTHDKILATVGPMSLFEQKNTETIPYSLRSIFTAAASVDRLVLTGGTHFHTRGKFSDRIQVFSFYILLVFWAKLWRTRVDMVAHGIGPIKGVLFRYITATVLRLVDTVSVRDPQSQETLDSLRWLDTAETVLGFDLAPLLDAPTEDERTEVRKPELDGLTVGVSLTPAYEKYYDTPERDERLVRKVAEAIGASGDASHRIERVVIFVLHTGEFNDDVSMSAKLEAELEEYTTELRPYRNDPASFIDSMEDVDRFIGMKYHSLVFSFLQEIPTLAIAYHPKCRSFQDYTGHASEATVDMDKAVSSGIRREVNELVNDPDRYRASMTTDRATSLAQRSFQSISVGETN